ncbi:MAG: hypothetical protein IJH37_09190, partial [Clostridia bacterium]|nr:hypothetical protein [Clostridia bacterium]
HELHSQMKLPLDVHRKLVYNLSVEYCFSYLYFTPETAFCKEAVSVFLIIILIDPLHIRMSHGMFRKGR